MSRAWLIAIILALAGCATPLPPNLPRGAQGAALAPQPGGPLAQLETVLQQQAANDQSGFLLLDRNDDGLRWRLALVDAAQHSLDLQYYVWWGDESGLLLAKHVVAAADRGVKVRLLLDDLSTILLDAAHPRLRDRTAALLDAHPNIELRLFNPWHERELAGRVVELAGNLERINQRMHNKLLVADNRVAILGGRNIGNEYFGLSAEFNFRDLDVLGVGPVARQASAVFDRFWNSDWVVPVAALGIETTAAEGRAAYADAAARLAAAPQVARFALEPADRGAALAALPAQWQLGTSRVHTDTPDAGAVAHHMPAAFRELIGGAHSEVLIVNAYIIPGPHAVERMRQQTARGVRIRMLTNSLASHDVPAVNSHYKPWRKPLLEAGIELHEARADAAIRAIVADTAPVRSEFMGLHVKAMVIDRQRVFIGSMNLDPRSWAINSEMGVVIDSPGLAAQLAAIMERDMRPENAWKVTLAPDGSLRWRAGEMDLTSQPARNFWQRIEDVIFMAFPADLY